MEEIAVSYGVQSEGAIKSNDLQFVHDSNESTSHITIIVSADLVNALFDRAAHSQLSAIRLMGFHKEVVPISYIKSHFRNALIEHMKELLLKFCVIDFLYNELYQRKIVTAGEPILETINIEQGKPAEFVFSVDLVEPIQFIKWENLLFKAPKRKNYKDLDRQVEHLIAEEQKNIDAGRAGTVSVHDWILFSIKFAPTAENNLSDLPGYFWLKISDEDIDSPLRDLFIDKQLSATFESDSKGLQEIFSTLLGTNYLFKVAIHDIVKHKHFCFDQFKQYFKIKTQRDMHKKLIEVFSYRNDISQRRAMVQESLGLLLDKHKFQIPEKFLQRQQNNIIARIRENPDYNVYRRQPDFQTRIQELAMRQAKEMILVDQLIHHESVQVNNEDLKGYLNLLKRARTREFLSFEIPTLHKDGQPIPISAEQLKRVVSREKAVNYIIYHLTKK